jgi:hypothetical protein
MMDQIQNNNKNRTLADVYCNLMYKNRTKRNLDSFVDHLEKKYISEHKGKINQDYWSDLNIYWSDSNLKFKDIINDI